MIGTKLGHYEITSHLGSGGMGDVYQATDGRLGRSVAIKLLPAAFMHDAERVARFQREARVLASLNHPNIAGIHGVEETGGRHFLVMELVPGETLADRIQRGPIGVHEACSMAKQIAEALEAAHAQGIVHRDLKPANIKVTSDGRVKVLDFGLAKASNQDQDASLSNSPTLTLAATQNGVILGTAAYMSPEQAVGKQADHRSDIFSFGAVLFEMLSGKSAFDGESIAEILASIVKGEPDWRQLPSTTPARLGLLLRRCLAKDRRQRLQAIGEARIVLENAFADADAPIASTTPRRSLLWPAATGVLALMLAIAALSYFRRPQPARLQPFRFEIFPPGKAAFDPALALAPDGHALAFVARSENGATQVWIRDLNSLQSRALAGTEGASFLFWSPDSRSVAFSEGSRLKRIDLAGGAVQLICELPGKRIGQGAWNKDGVILFGVIAGGGQSEGMRRVSAAGGAPSVLTRPDPAHPGEFHDFPFFMSDGRRFLYLRIAGDAGSGIFTGAIDAAPDQQPAERLTSQNAGFVYIPARPDGAEPNVGALLLQTAAGLVAQGFDEKRIAMTGDSAPITDKVGRLAAYGFYTASSNGVLAYRSGGETAAQVTWFDREGKNLRTLGEPNLVQWAAVSPDGKAVAMDRRDLQSGLIDIWTYSLVRGTASRFTFNSLTNRYPLWSPDGRYIAFSVLTREGNSDIYRKASNGVGTDEVLDKDSRIKVAYDWSRDGQYLIEGVLEPKTKYDIWVLPLKPQAKAFPYLQTEFNEKNARLSPDGRWLAYSSDETNQNELYVQTFPQHGGKWQVSTNGGDLPVWSHDGKQLFFIDGDGRMTVVDVKNSDAKNSQFEAGLPTPLFEARLGILGETRFDVAPDGRFLIPSQAAQTERSPITVLVNWR